MSVKYKVTGPVKNDYSDKTNWPFIGFASSKDGGKTIWINLTALPLGGRIYLKRDEPEAETASGGSGDDKPPF